MNPKSQAHIGWFRNTAPYIKAHRGATFVLSVPGAAELEGRLSALAQDIALLTSLGVRLVVVFGCREQIDQQLAAANQEIRFHSGERITDAQAMPIIQAVVGSQRIAWEAALSMGMPNSPMQGARLRVSSGNFVSARPRGVIDGIDHQLTGHVRRVDRSAMKQLLDSGMVVLQPSLGFSPTGEIFNLTREEVSISVAQALNADKLILFGAEPGLADTSGTLLRQIVAGEVTADQVEGGEAQVLLYSATRACEIGVPRCHIVSWRIPDALLAELFTTDGVGTLVSSKPFEHSRWASIDDVGGILELLAPLEESGVLRKRSRELLEAEIHQFRLLERDGRIIACAALYPVEDDDSGELACIVTDPEYRGGRRARRLLEELEEEARKRGLAAVFVLTTQTAHWFIEQGFVESGRTSLPSSRQALYNLQRNSKVFRKNLDES